MDENKNLKNNNESDNDLDILVSETSVKHEPQKRTRAVPRTTRIQKPVPAPQNKSEHKNEEEKAKTVVTPPLKPTTVNTPAKPAPTTVNTPVPSAPPKAKKPTASSSPAKPKNPEKHDENEEKSGGLLSGIAKALIYIVCVIAISGVLSYFGIIYSNDIFAFVKAENSAEITITENTTVSELADLLYSNGMIEYPGVFKFYTWYRHRNNENPIELNPGTYTVSSQLNYDMLLSTFKKKVGARTIVTLTFKEGLTVDETIDIFLEAGIGTKEAFVEAINNYDYDYRFVKELENWRDIPGRKYRLEGYLSPDTYDFYTDSDESFIISKLLSNFNQKFEEEYYDRCVELGYTVDEIITLASIIEKEGYLQEDLELISSVFHNRLKNWANPYLQSDATIQYSFEERKKEITRDDLKIDSPYNTYLYKGLPPSAISNPGLESILAALYPTDSSYYYFVTRSNGAAIFSRTLGEHNNAVANIEKESKNRVPDQAANAETDNIIG